MTDHDNDIRAAARANIKARNDFHVMLTIFGVITLMLIAIWFFSTGPGSYFWPVWPVIGMGIAAVFAGLDAYGITRRRITEADIDAEIARMTAGRAAKAAPAPAPAPAATAPAATPAPARAAAKPRTTKPKAD